MIERPNLLAGEDLPPEPRQKRSIEKRVRLKQSALALFGERGFEGTSIEEIAARAGLAVGGFYQHFRSKRQLLLVLMNDLLEALSRLDFRLQADGTARDVLHELLARAFARDFQYLGAYRAWQEAMMADTGLARKNQEIHAWTTARVMAVFKMLQQMSGSRAEVDIPGLARAMDTFFWSLLAQALHMKKTELDRWIDAATHLIYHALFRDQP
ncbi:MAG TPA: helix-turn-helix domain-containing protein [Bryobacteraceae bacterium]|nr:helix-turn-helix domain-containing protein [Bryobacteraceae bacterium]